jgi:hypothetical protein
MQIFPRALNLLPLVVAIGGALAGGAVTGVVWYYFSPLNTQVGYAPVQPVPYSHRLHAGNLGIDCRYCHANVERSAEAMIPPTQTCMGCHSLIRTESARLTKVRESWETGRPIEWVRVHKLPEHAFFDHSVHLAAGVGCSSCHGRVDQMDVVRVDEVAPMSMGQCLACHRDPLPHLRPRDQITNMEWTPDQAVSEQIAETRPVHPPEHCSGCHR